MYIGIPVALFFMAAVIGTQVGMGLWNDKNLDDYDKKVPNELRYTPSLVNVALIFIYGFAYKIVANILVDRENHRY